MTTNEESNWWIRTIQAIEAARAPRYTTTATATDWASKWVRLEVMSPAISGWYWIASDKKSKPIICYVHVLASGWAEVRTDTHTYTPHDAGVLWWPERISEPPPP